MNNNQQNYNNQYNNQQQYDNNYNQQQYNNNYNQQYYNNQQQGYNNQQQYNNYNQQQYNNNYNQQQGYNNQQQYYDYQPMNNSGITFQVNQYDPNDEANGKELFCIAQGNGNFFAKKGSMVAYQGQFKFSKRLLGTNDGNIVGQVLNHIGRKVTGENLEIMEVSGSGKVYLADQASHVSIIPLQHGESICVESEDLLAFTKSCHYGVCCVPMGTLSQKGLFTSKLTGQGNDAQVAIKSNGNPLILETPCSVDPDALVAWTGPSPIFGVDVNLKTLIGQTSGESYRFDFRQPGYIVIVQPYERESGLKVAIDDNNYRPSSQTRNNGPIFGNDTPQNQGGSGIMGGLGGILGNILGN